jgi:hypothetical protein
MPFGSWPHLVRFFPWLLEVYIDRGFSRRMKALTSMEV